MDEEYEDDFYDAEAGEDSADWGELEFADATDSHPLIDSSYSANI